MPDLPHEGVARDDIAGGLDQERQEVELHQTELDRLSPCCGGRIKVGATGSNQRLPASEAGTTHNHLRHSAGVHRGIGELSRIRSERNR